MVLSFLVFDWDGPLVGDDLMGVAKLTLPQVCAPLTSHTHMTPPTFLQDQSELIQHDVLLVGDAHLPSGDMSLGKLVVSVVFRPVASVGRASPECHMTTVGGGAMLLEEGGGDKVTGREKHGIKLKAGVDKKGK